MCTYTLEELHVLEIEGHIEQRHEAVDELKLKYHTIEFFLLIYVTMSSWQKYTQ